MEKNKLKIYKEWNVFYLFLFISLSISISMGQEEVLITKSLLYWILIAASLIPILLTMKVIVINIILNNKWILVFAFITFIFNIYREKVDFLISLVFLTVSWAYVLCSKLTLNKNSIAKTFIAIVIFGICIKIYSNTNYYEIFPFIITNNLSEGRVSFAGNIGFAGILSLLVFMLLATESKTTVIVKIAILLALYFIIFSQVRTAWIGLALFFVTKRILIVTKEKSKFIIMLLVLLLTIFSTVLLSLMPQIISFFKFDLFRLNLITQGRSLSDADELARQMYRPLLWAEQINQFYSSPYLMGLGSAASSIDLFGGVDAGYGGDTVSYPTRLLAYYGMPSLLFIYATIYALWRHVKLMDSSAICAWPVCYLVMLNWGSIFHPTDVVGILYLLLIFKGSTVFVSDFKGLNKNDKNDKNDKNLFFFNCKKNTTKNCSFASSLT